MPFSLVIKPLSEVQTSGSEVECGYLSIQVHHIHPVLDVPKAICFADNQLDFVVGSFDPCITEAKTDRVQNMLLMAFDFLVKLLECRYSAVARPPEPVLQIGLRLFNIG